jgi:hypothetical protein
VSKIITCQFHASTVWRCQRSLCQSHRTLW